MKVARLKAYKDGRMFELINMVITKAYTLEQFQDARISFIENLKHYYDRFETELLNV